MSQRNDDSERLHFGNFIDRSFWFVITAAVLFCAREFRTLTDSVESLNLKVGAVIEHMGYQDKRLDEHDKKLDQIEDDFRKAR